MIITITILTDTHNNNKINNNKKHIDVIDQEVNVMTAVS